jgi:hypothetical protein
MGLRMHWTVVYDFARDWFSWSDWIFPTSGLPFVLIGFFWALSGSWFRGGIVAIMGGTWSVFHTVDALDRYETLSRAYRERTYQVAEGTIENFQTPRCRAKGGESFEVNGVGFHYSDGRVQMGFRQTQCSGGPMRAGLYVRIWYVDRTSRHILRLEIRR